MPVEEGKKKLTKKVWYPVSRIKKEFTQMDKESKTIRSRTMIRKLNAENADYFRGK